MPAMGKLPIKNGTPVGSVSLCNTCSYAQIMTGFKESELENPTIAIGEGSQYRAYPARRRARR